MPRNKDNYKKYQHEYYLRRKETRQSQAKQLSESNGEFMKFIKQLLKLLTASNRAKPYDDAFNKFCIINGEPNEEWNDKAKLEWYKKLLLHLLAL